MGIGLCSGSVGCVSSCWVAFTWVFYSFCVNVCKVFFICSFTRTGTGRQIIDYVATYATLSICIKIIAVIGLIDFVNNRTTISYAKNSQQLLNVYTIIYSIYAFLDIFYVLLTIVLIKCVKYELIVLNPEILENCINNSSIVRFDPIYRGTECVICLDRITENSIIRKTVCNHIFHDECVLPWFKINSSCPICRYKFENLITTI